MRLLLDQNMSEEIAVALRSRGIDVVHTRDVGLATADDERILEWCRREERVAFTRDADFHALLAISGETKPSVVRIRIEALPDTDLTRIIEWIVREKNDQLIRGVAITVKSTSIRVHELPLITTGGDDDV